MNIPKWKLEWYLLNELPADDMAAIAALERSDGELRGRIAALRASDAEMLAKYPPEAMARRAMEAAAAAARKGGAVRNSIINLRARFAPRGKSGTARASAPTGTTLRLWERGAMPRWAVPAFACAALLIALPIWMFGTNTTDLDAYGRILKGNATDLGARSAEPPHSGGMELAYAAGDRAKGIAGAGMPSPSLEVWRKTGGDAEQLAPQTAVRAGDVVQLRYTVPKPCYGALVSVDGRGLLTVHLSGDNGKAARLTAGAPVALGTSYRLDDAPKYEAFYLITASDIFELDSIAEALKREIHPLYDKSLPHERQVTAFTLIKSDGGGVN